MHKRGAQGKPSLLLRPARKVEVKYKNPLYEGIRELLRQPGLKWTKISQSRDWMVRWADILLSLFTAGNLLVLGMKQEAGVLEKDWAVDSYEEAKKLAEPRAGSWGWRDKKERVVRAGFLPKRGVR